MMKRNTAIATGTAAGVVLLLFMAVVLLFVMTPVEPEATPPAFVAGN